MSPIAYALVAPWICPNSLTRTYPVAGSIAPPNAPARNPVFARTFPVAQNYTQTSINEALIAASQTGKWPRTNGIHTKHHHRFESRTTRCTRTQNGNACVFVCVCVIVCVCVHPHLHIRLDGDPLGCVEGGVSCHDPQRMEVLGLLAVSPNRRPVNALAQQHLNTLSLQLLVKLHTHTRMSHAHTRHKHTVTHTCTHANKSTHARARTHARVTSRCTHIRVTRTHAHTLA